jgi:hypothetical protein
MARIFRSFSVRVMMLRVVLGCQLLCEKVDGGGVEEGSWLETVGD